MMEPFANVNEALTFLGLFFVAVVVIPFAFIKIGEWLYD